MERNTVAGSVEWSATTERAASSGIRGTRVGSEAMTAPRRARRSSTADLRMEGVLLALDFGYRRYINTNGIGMATRVTRSERKARTRASCSLAARTVFLRRGFHGASLDEIAEEAGYTKGAVYSNFAGKDDLYLALLGAHYERVSRHTSR